MVFVSRELDFPAEVVDFLNPDRRLHSSVVCGEGEAVGFGICPPVPIVDESLVSFEVDVDCRGLNSEICHDLSSALEGCLIVESVAVDDLLFLPVVSFWEERRI